MKCRTAYCAAIALIALALLLLSGCLGQRQTETGAISGVVAGQPIVVKWTRDGESHTNLEIPPEVISGLTSGLSATPWGALIAGGVSIAAAAIAGRQSGVAKVQTARADEHKADSDEAWDKLANGPK